MKLLFDQNISFRVVGHVVECFPNSGQIRELGLENATDIEIWKFAKENGYTIVTFDSDFADIANVKGCPPKIIWLRTSNLKTLQIAELVLANQELIREFLEGKEYGNISCLRIE